MGRGLCQPGALQAFSASPLVSRPTHRVPLGDNDGVPNLREARPRRRSGSRPESTWVDVALPIGLVLLVSVPVMVVEEGWHSRPMIDEGTHLWILPAFLVAAAFFLGGAFTGFRRPSSAVSLALAVASISLVTLLLGAVVRRVWIVHEGTQNAVLFLWFLGVTGAITLSVIGSCIGRRLANRPGIQEPSRG
jgi:hypothetical protein